MTIDAERVRRLGDAISKLYAASWDDAGWNDALRAIARVFDADATFLRLTNGDVANDDFIAVHGYTQADIDEYARDYAHEDYWTIEGVAKVRGGAILTGDQLVPRERIAKTGMLNDFLAVRGMSDCLAIPFQCRDDTVSVLVLNGRGEEGRFRAHHVELAQILQSHLEEALVHRQRLGGARDMALGERLAALDAGLSLFDMEGRQVCETPLFRTLADAAGLFRAKANGPFLEAHPAVRQLAATALERGAGGSVAVRAENGSTYLVRCVPAVAGRLAARLGGENGVMVTLELLDPAHERSTEAAAEAWGLSKRERELLRAIIATRSTNAAGERLGISYETARSHLKAIYSKAGVHGLAELLGAVMAVTIAMD